MRKLGCSDWCVVAGGVVTNGTCWHVGVKAGDATGGIKDMIAGCLGSTSGGSSGSGSTGRNNSNDDPLGDIPTSPTGIIPSQ